MLWGPLAPSIWVGIVVDVVAVTRCYRVQLSPKTITAVDASAVGSHPLGPRSFGGYQAGSPVIVLWTPSMAHGYILGAAPSLVGALKQKIIDHVVPFAGGDAYNDPAHRYPLLLQNSGGLGDFSGSQPPDAVTGSDRGVINELGLGYGLSRTFAWLRASELCGVWAFWIDQLLRIAAYNFEMWTAGGDTWIKNDEGEVNGVALFTPYPWEALGLLDRGGDAFTAGDGGRFKPGGSDKTWYTTKEEGQRGIFRHARFTGYLGEGVRDVLCVPEKDRVPPVETVKSLSDYTGVLDVHKGLDGMFSVRSARGIILEKYVLIPVPKQIAVPEDGETLGDGAGNYRAAGADGTGPEHDKRPFKWDNVDYALDWGPQLWDFHAYQFNWFGSLPFIRHAKDWLLPEENKVPGGGSTTPKAAYVPTEALRDKFLFKVPPSVSLKVDHRLTQDYYLSRSCINQLPDGSIIIEDGYGSSIHMTGGSVFISCPGDIFGLPGRNTNFISGRDTVLRSQGDVEVSSARRSVMVKSQVNTHLLSGNGGTGGLLLENRATTKSMTVKGKTGSDVVTSGIVLKSKTAPVAVYAGGVYIRALDRGEIVLDADAGLGRLSLVADSHVVYAKSNITQVFGTTPDDAEKDPSTVVTSFFNDSVAIFGQKTAVELRSKSLVHVGEGGSVVLGGNLQLRGSATVSGSVSMGGSLMANGLVVSLGANIAQAHVNATGGMTGKYQKAPDAVKVEDIDKTIQDLASDLEENNTATAQANQRRMLALYYDDNKLGDLELVAYIGFSFRSSEQCGVVLNEFHLVEARWQQLYRKKSVGYAWEEPDVLAPAPDGQTGEATQPYPGKDLWSGDTLVVNDLALWDWQDAKNVARTAGAYADAKGAKSRKQKPSSSWLVSVELKG